jgi:hypothetical protein
MGVTVALLAGLATPALSQPATVVNFKTLQQFLPAVAPPGYVRQRPTGHTTTAMGVSVSEAQVVYQREARESDTLGTPTMTVTITDYAGNQLVGAFTAMAMSMAGEINEETQDGYRKTITVQGRYKGMEEATTTPDSRSCKISFVVANRFAVDLAGALTDDVASLRKLLDNMKLDQLERAAPAKP